ncbi:PIG-L family deacetylase [Corynebacterium macginleyi]|uniref:PIG-L family deacetylase n=1 Tax=Corynebacterium macginleyi TaxID=38290 RepID=UPI000EFA2EF6|nr:PIG-L family deacetylase [Corynebacterium macginleyi]QRP20628.1 PIG-L family deacetylase [Corynebacterium macginleyi]RMB67610.1 N-acetyl-1-D-myo-inositol-2-amino-2-deoxy-alpha-D-glucopyranoside deacetylase [Corynebacterium macginleyi]RMB70501.1 N-acetyl-1-D-myo-inositol-2-amino-2-deoxy-alpha-D-glucopyranoside deacetylase [Corynebacterium macginleyi]
MRDKDLVGYRVVAVHAHPDDETLFTGGTLATLAARGAQVTVITFTLGEEGEVIGAPYQGLAEHDQLGGFRAHELACALSLLGAEGIQLGGFGHFRDSGMVGSSSHDNPRALVNRVDEAVDLLRVELEMLQPHAILTYGPDGGYGHPDHVAVHRVVEKAASASTRIWWAIFDRAANYAGLDKLEAPAGWCKPDAAYLDNFTTADADLTFALDGAALNAKRAAMRAHATQIWLADGTTSATNPAAAVAALHEPLAVPGAYCLSNRLLMPLLCAEYFQLGRGEGARELLGGL